MNPLAPFPVFGQVPPGPASSAPIASMTSVRRLGDTSANDAQVQSTAGSGAVA